MLQPDMHSLPTWTEHLAGRRRLFTVAAQTLGVAKTMYHSQAGGNASSSGKRMRELSMLVHPDKCSLPGAEQVCFKPPWEVGMQGLERGGGLGEGVCSLCVARVV